jgi:N-acetylmuramoyl-L-alanine amidase
MRNNDGLISLTKGVPELGNNGVHYQNLALTHTTSGVDQNCISDRQGQPAIADGGRQRIANGIATGIEKFYKQLRR